MRGPVRPASPWPERLLASLLLLVVVALAAAKRWVEPAASRVVVAEDPLTHIVFTKEHLARGYFADSFHLGTSMYPPGLHAYAGAVSSLAGIDLYTLAIWAPVALGILAIASLFLLAWRTAGAAAAFVAALLAALFPEVIFRSVLFSPTVLDLALLPVLFLCLAEAMDGRPSLAIGAGAVGVALALAHPWVVSLAVATGLLVLVLHHQLPPRTAGPQAPRGRAWAAATLAVLAILAGLLELTQDADKGLAGANSLLVAAAAALAGLLALDARLGGRAPRLGSLLQRPVPAVALGVLAAAGAWSLLAFAGNEPGTVNVNYSLMLGPAAAVAALAGFATYVLARSNLAHWGLALTVVVFPLTAADFFGLWYIPHRSVVFLALGVAMLGGSAAQAVVELARGAVAGRGAARPRAARWVAVAVTVALVAVATPTVAAATPERPYTWYRLFNDEEFKGLEWTAARTYEGGAVRVMTHSWQSNAFLKALGEPDQVVYDQGFYRGDARPLWEERSTPGHLYAVVDAHTRAEVGDPFAGHGAYEVAWSCSCGTLTVYRWVGA